jgi:uncharacterized protein involved in exopolysaccharide biosynthesis
MKETPFTHCAWCDKRILEYNLLFPWHCSQKCHKNHHDAYEKLEVDELLASFALKKREMQAEIDDLRQELSELLKKKQPKSPADKQEIKRTTSKELSALYTTIASLLAERDEKERPWTLKNAELMARVEELEKELSKLRGEK